MLDIPQTRTFWNGKIKKQSKLNPQRFCAQIEKERDEKKTDQSEKGQWGFFLLSTFYI
jgi:hypothetical protein